MGLGRYVKKVRRQVKKSVHQVSSAIGHSAAKVAPYVLGVGGAIVGGPVGAGVGAGIGTTLDRVYNDDASWSNALKTGTKAGAGVGAGAYLVGAAGNALLASGMPAAGAGAGATTLGEAGGGAVAGTTAAAGATGASSYLPWILGGTTVLNAGAGMYAAKQAADAQTKAAELASTTQLQMFEEGRADTAPWRVAGASALSSLVGKINAGPGEYTSSPGYAFRTAEGEKAVERSAAAKGGLFSGRTGKELTRFGQDYATADYQNFLDNYYKSLTPLQSLAGLGQTTASQDAANGNAVAAHIANNTINAGNATAGGYINQANAVTGATNSGINNFLMWKYLNNSGAASPVSVV